MKDDTTFDKVLLVLIFILAMFSCMMYCTSQAEGAEYPKARDLHLDLGVYTSEASRDAYLDTPKTGALYAKMDLTWNLDLTCGYYPKICWYFDNTIHSKAGQNHFRHVGWEWQMGLDFGKYQLYYYHYSQHMMEQVSADRKFPVEDAYMIRFNFLRGGK